jgi:hypothetical protein
MPLLDEEIMKLRKNVNGAYTKFCDDVLSQVVGRQDWKQNCGKKMLREYASASDEAFGLLILENSWMMWKEMAEKTDHDGEVITNKTKYTLNGAGTKKNGGWKHEGIKRFNELAQMVKADREKDKQVFEQAYMEMNTKNNKRGGAVAFEMYDCGNDDNGFEVYIDDDYKVTAV